MERMAEQPSDVVVVGGGVIGLSVAYYCARDGLSVTVLERGELGQESSWAGAGIIPAGRGESARSAYAKLLGVSGEIYPKISEELRQETGIDNGYRRCGGLEIGCDEADAHALRSAAGHYRSEGVDWIELSPSAARKLEPALQGPFRVAYHIPGMAQVRNPRHIKALAAACARRRVRLVTGAEVSGFQIEQDRVLGVRTLDATFSGATTVVTAGAWSRGLLQSAGVSLPVRPVRGQIVLLQCGTPLLSRVIMMGKRYLVPRSDGRVLIGSTEEEVGFDKRTTANAARELLEVALAIAPPLGQAQVERAWAGLRPGNPDGKPFIGPVPGLDGLLVAAGHFRSGLQLAPVTGLMIKQLILGEPTSVPLEAFRLDHLSDTSRRTPTAAR